MKKFNAVVKPFVALICMGMIFAGIWGLLRYLLIDDTTAGSRLIFHEFYEQENIDILFLGASHCGRGIDTPFLDQELGVDTYNLGTPSQSLEMSYMLLQEASERYDIKQVYIDLNIRKLSKKSDNTGDNPTKFYLATDYMKVSFRKIKFLLMNAGADNLVNSFLIAHREGKKLFDPSYISKLLNKKRQEGYKKYASVMSKFGYEGKGFCYNDNDDAPKQGNMAEARECFIGNIEEVDPEWPEAVQKIITLCKERSIQLTFISVPMTPFVYHYMDQYEEFSGIVSDYVAESGIEFVDFNCLREEYLPDTSELFYDSHHLNRKGAALFSRALAHFIKGDVPREELFHNSLQERMEALDPNVYGMSYERSDDTSFHCELISNKPEQISFCVYAVKLNGEKILVRDWGSDIAFDVPVIFEPGREYITCCFEAKWEEEELSAEIRIPII